MTNLSQNFDGLKSEILDTLSKAEFELEHDHAVDTLRWVKKIDNNASEHLQIAALTHDIERGERNPTLGKIVKISKVLEISLSELFDKI